MAKFHFKLDGVLRHRKHLEQEKQRKVALAQAQVALLQNELRALNDSVQASLDDLRTNHLVGRIDLNFLAAHRRFTNSMQRRAMGLVQKTAGLQKQLDDARRELADAARQRKIIEKLRERQFNRWKESLNQKEMAEMDEISMRIGYDLEKGEQEVAV